MICSFELIIGLPLSTQANHNFANVNIRNDKHDPVRKLLLRVSKSLCQPSLISGCRSSCAVSELLQPHCYCVLLRSDIQQFSVLPTDTEGLFCNPDGMCLLRGTD